MRKQSLVRTNLSVPELRAVGQIERPAKLENRTYKLKPHCEGFDTNLYVSIGDAEVEDKLRPFEVFINTSHARDYAYLATVVGLVSSRFQEPGPFPAFLIYELIDAFDNVGGYVCTEQWLRKHVPESKVNSIVAHIGWVILYHCRSQLRMKINRNKPYV